jgi:hypothetical protein
MVQRTFRMKACEMRFKQPQKKTKLSPKLTPKSKRNITKENTRREDTYKDKTTWLT